MLVPQTVRALHQDCRAALTTCHCWAILQYLISMSTHLDTYIQGIHHRPMRPCPLSAATAGSIRKKTITQSFPCTHATYHAVTHAFMFVGRLELRCVHMSGPTCVHMSGPHNTYTIRAPLVYGPPWLLTCDCQAAACWLLLKDEANTVLTA